jgi:hypothetical protein
MAQKKKIWICEKCENVGCVVYEDSSTSIMGVRDLIKVDHAKECSGCNASVESHLKEISVGNLVGPGSGIPLWAWASIIHHLETVGAC